MKLSELVDYYTRICSLDLENVSKSAISTLEAAMHQTEEPPTDIANTYITALQEKVVTTKDSIDRFAGELHLLREAIAREIVDNEQPYFAASTELYDTALRNDTPERIMGRIPTLHDETREFVNHRIRMYSSWQHPGMVIRPGVNFDYINGMVASDPLYLVDTHADLLTPVRKEFTAEYQRRLRMYVIKEYSNDPMFPKLPHNQFSFCFAFNYFNFKPLEIIQKYIVEVYGLLCPGGVFAFTYNNCDIANAVKLTENFSGCYTPGSSIRSYATKRMGFELIHEYNSPEGLYWIELRKPGKLESIRGGQTLAMVKQLPEPPVPPTPSPIVPPTPPETPEELAARLLEEERIRIEEERIRQEQAEYARQMRELEKIAKSKGIDHSQLDTIEKLRDAIIIEDVFINARAVGLDLKKYSSLEQIREATAIETNRLNEIEFQKLRKSAIDLGITEVLKIRHASPATIDTLQKLIKEYRKK